MRCCLTSPRVLAWAVDRQDVESVHMLLAAGAKPNIVDVDGASPLTLACELGRHGDRHRPAQGRRRCQACAGRRHQCAGIVRRQLHARSAGPAGRKGRRGQRRRSAGADRPDVGCRQGPHRQHLFPAGAWRQGECGFPARLHAAVLRPAQQGAIGVLGVAGCGCRQQGRIAGRHFCGRRRRWPTTTCPSP